MNIRKLILYGIVVFSLCSFAPPAHSQVPGLSRREFSKLDVLQRAAFFERTIASAAEKEGVDPLLLWTIAYNETRFRPWLTSPKNAQGLMQFIPTTAARFGLRDPYEPTAAIFAAARYVKLLSGMFVGRMDSILAAYNAGEGTVSAYLNGYSLRTDRKVINSTKRRTPGGIPPYAETIGYVRRGLSVYKALQRRKIFRANSDIAIAEVKERTAPEETGEKEARATEIFYDPRSGKRVLIGSQKYRAIDAGPVIVSPTARPSVVANARTTFFRKPNR